MTDLLDDQLPEDEDPLTSRVMGRGNVHSKFKWIADGLDAVKKSQADLARVLEWDAPTMSRQLKNKRVLGADELILIHKFFAGHGLLVGPIADAGNAKLTTSVNTADQDAEPPRADLEGKLELSIRLLDELQKTVDDLRGRVQTLEQERRIAAGAHFKEPRRR